MWIIFLTSLMLGCMFGIIAGQHGTSGEPACYSRFDYEHKVLTSLVALETEQARLQGIIRKQDDVIEALQTKLPALETDQTNMQGIIKNQDDVIDALQSELTDVKSTVQTLTDQMQHIDIDVSIGESGSTYVRWGRTICPGNGTELVYDGYVGGSYYTDAGGAANYLCLPKDPIWGYFIPGDQSGARVYGAEYEMDKRFFGRQVALYNNDVPCAVCRTKMSSTLMVPARNKCHDGWTLEYHGYLSAGHFTHAAASEFVCLDAAPESIGGGSANSNGKLFYTAEAKCGSLRCPPYVEDQELTCAVCSI